VTRTRMVWLFAAVLAAAALPVQGWIDGAGAVRPASAGSAPSSERLDAFVRALAKEGRFSGSVLVARGGKVLLAKGYGSATLTPERRNAPATTFRIGSITKTFTALAVLQLAQQRRLRLDAPVCSLIPACPRSWRPITIRMLLAHTAGLSARLDNADLAKLKDVPLARVVARLKTLPLEFRPGSRWSYCNACYLVAGYIVERVTKSDWLSYLRRRIFRPAGMTATTYDSGRAGATGALAYVPDRLGVMRRAPHIAMANPDTAGGLRSSVLDLYRFARALETNRC
jgi:CubicO group peptidase (beta-lactamase class C family)